MKRKRKNYSPEEKVAILKRHLVDKIAVSDLCDEYHLQPTVSLGHVRTVEPVFVETDKSQPTLILGAIGPKIITDGGTETDQQAIMHLL